MEGGESVLLYKEFTFLKNKILFFPDSFSLIELEKTEDKEEVVTLFETYIKSSKFSELPQLEMLEIDLCVTRRCNLRCKYCYANQVHSEDEDLSYDVAKRVIDFFIKKYGNLKWKVDFIGQGEPLLKIDLIIKIVNYIKAQKKDKELSFFVITNGTLLSNENYSELSNNGISIGVSIDGSEKNHDMNRIFPNGEGSFGVIKKNLEHINMQKSSNNIWGLSVATGENNVTDMLKFNKILGFKRLQIKIARITGTRNVNRKIMYMNLAKQYEEYFQMLKNSLLKDEWDIFFSIINETDAIGKIIKAFLIRQKNFRRCKAGFARFSVLTNGDIYPCSSFGSIQEYKMGNALQRKISEDICNEFAVINVDVSLKCKNCWCKYMCGGMCRYSSFVEFEALSECNQYDCKLTKMICEQVIKLVYEIKKMDETILRKMIRFAALTEYE